MYNNENALTDDLIHLVEARLNVCLCYMPAYADFQGDKLEQTLEGELPLVDANEALHFARARLLDVDKYAFILFKPRFCETGLNRALDIKKDEYTSLATQYIEQNITYGVNKSPAFVFKHYIGFTRSDDGALTTTDALGNRGMRMTRALAPYEMLGDWQVREDVVEVIKNLQEQTLSV
jgi:hypothetical protein